MGDPVGGRRQRRHAEEGIKHSAGPLRHVGRVRNFRYSYECAMSIWEFGTALQ